VITPNDGRDYENSGYHVNKWPLQRPLKQIRIFRRRTGDYGRSPLPRWRTRPSSGPHSGSAVDRHIALSTAFPRTATDGPRASGVLRLYVRRAPCAGTAPATPKPGRHSRRHTATPRPGSPKPSWTSAARPPDQGKPASPYPLRKASRLPDPAAPARHADCSVDSVGLPAPRSIRLMSACRTPDRSASSRWESPQATRASRYCRVSPVPWESDWNSPEPGCGLAGVDELADCASSLPTDEATGG
jgi:hypothetical protein